MEPLQPVPFTGSQHHDVQAFNKLYHEWKEKIFIYCLGFLKEVTASEDATTEVFVKLWKYRSRINALTHVTPFLYITARNHCIDIIRKDPRFKGLVVSFKDDPEMFNSPTGRYNPEEAAAEIFEEAWKILLEGTKDLSHEQGIILELKRKGLTTKEIATHLGVTPSNVYFHWPNIQKVLRRYLKTHGRSLFLLALAGLGIYYFLDFFIFHLVFESLARFY